MRHLILLPILAGGLAVTLVTAAPVRTLAFDLPATAVTFDLIAANNKTDSKTDPKDKLRIEARMNQFSLPVSLPPGRYLASSSAFKSTAPFTLPDIAGGRFLLLILPQNDGSCAIFPIPDDITKIGPGDRFLLNATKQEIVVRFGTQRSIIKPGHSEYLRPPWPAPADQRMDSVQFHLLAARPPGTLVCARAPGPRHRRSQGAQSIGSAVTAGGAGCQ
jgi:hypothetical protein